jgi:hypothetical protein
MKTWVYKHILLILFLTNAASFAQTPSVTTQTPVVVTPYIYQVNPSSAFTYDAKVTFTGIVNPGELECTVYFEYGPTTSYGNTVAASPAIVAGTDDIAVRATSVIHNCENDYHCRMYVVSGGVTYYGSDISFAPEVDPTIKLLFTANCSDDASATSFSITNNNYFPVSLTCTDGTNTATLNFGQKGQQDFICNKNRTVSFYYNYTNPDSSIVYPFLFRKMLTNDLGCQEMPNPQTQITITSHGYSGNKDAAYYDIANANDVDVEMLIIQGTAQSTFIVRSNNHKTLLLLYNAVDFYYNNFNFASFPAPLVKTKYTYQYVPLDGGFYNFNDYSVRLCHAFPNKVYLDASDNAMTFRVVANTGNYQLLPNQSWINRVSDEFIYANDIPLSFNIGNNTTGQSRTGYITVTSGAPNCNVTVVQSGFTIPKNNLKLRLRADQGVTVSGSLVSEWDDISGKGNNATQSTGANQPIYIAGAMNNMPVIRFNGSSSKLTLPTSTALGIQSNPYEMFIVAKSNSSNVQFLISGNANEQFEYHLNGDAGARFIPISSTFIDEGTTGSYTDGNAHVFSARANSSGGAVRIDGIEGGTSLANILSSNSGALQLGVRSDGTYYFNGDIAEVILYNTVLSETDRSTVEHYLADRYGITTGALPVELTSFTTSTANKKVTLNWQTATEVNNYGFDIERTVETLHATSLQWSKIGFIQGNGNSNSPKNYSFTDIPTGGTEFKYRLKQIDLDGKYEYSDVVNVTLAAPANFAIEQNFPNPFNPTTSIQYQVSGTSNVTIKVYDVLGKDVATLVNETKTPGKYEVKFDGSTLSSGIYFYKLTAGDFIQTKKLILMK